MSSKTGESILYSPFSSLNISQENNKAILLQFILFELFYAKKAATTSNWSQILSSSTPLFLGDFSCQASCLDKLKEHTKLLEIAFPSCIEAIDHFKTGLLDAASSTHSQKFIKVLKKLYQPLKTLIYHCKSSETLLFFLLKHHKELFFFDSKENFQSLIEETFIDDELKEKNGSSSSILERIIERLCDSYSKSNLEFLILEVKDYFSDFKKSIKKDG